jgi:hypothetical protein
MADIRANGIPDDTGNLHIGGRNNNVCNPQTGYCDFDKPIATP